MTHARSVPVLSALLALLVVAWAPPSDACINPVKLEMSKAVKLIARAERLVADGEYKKALDLIDKRQGFRHGAPFPYIFRDKALQRKGTLILATALIRLPDAHGAEVGVSHLESLVQKDEDNPLLAARIAEGNARSTEQGERDLALAALNDLDERDLVPDAEAYAALATLRREAKDAEGAEAAIAKCAKMAKRVGICPAAEPKAETKGK
jgi:hypothetical protein